MKKINTSLFISFIIANSCSINMPNMLVISQNETKISTKSLQIDSSEYSKIKDKFFIKNNLSNASDHLSALTPQFPMAEVTLDSSECTSTKSFIDPSTGFLSRKCKKYIIKNKDTYELIEDLDQLKKIYAPIDSKEEALSYAIAISGFKPEYNFTNNTNSNIIYKVNNIEKTNVKEVDDAYKVNLFNDFCFRLTEQISKITKKGDLEIISNKLISEDSTNKGVICD